MPFGMKEQKKLLRFSHELMTTEQDFRRQVLESLKRIFGYDNATFWLAEKKELYAPLTLQVPDKIMDEYFNYWQYDPFHPHNLSVAAARKNVLSLHAVAAEQYYVDNPYYQDILLPHRFKHKAVLLYKVNCKLIGASSILRTERERDFTVQDFEIFNYIAQSIGAPLAQYLSHKDLEAERAFFLAMADDSPNGIFLFDELFQFDYYNQQALRYCREWQVDKKQENPLRCLLQALPIRQDGLWRDGFSRQVISPLGNAYRVEIKPLPKLRKKRWYCGVSMAGGRAEASLSAASRQNLHITSREYEVAMLVCRGLNNEEIARRLFISIATVKTHLQSLFQKLQVGSRTQLILAMKDKQ